MRVLPLCGVLCLLGSSAVAAPSSGCKTAQSQVDMNVCAYQSYQAADARLNQTYRDLLARVTAAGRAKLQSAQRAWMAYRDAQCAFDSAGTIGGSIHPTILGECLEALTSDQVKRLDGQVHCQEGDLSCGGQ